MTDPQRTLWLDPGFGASGDMTLGALIGLGAPADTIRHQLAGLGVTGWELTVGPADRASISAVRAAVDLDPADAGHHHHRPWSTIDTLLAEADLPTPVRDGARRTFERLGRAEAGIHQIDLDHVHFHEVGAVDAIVDVVGVWLARHLLAVDRVVVGPVGLGHGTVTAAHGTLPVPAPATLALLEGVPVRSVDSPTETVTPTGAALLTSLADEWGPIPTGRIVGSARGAGGRNPSSHPNVLTAILVESSSGPGIGPDPEANPGEGPVRTEEAVILATNLDDVTPEVLGHATRRLLAAGADDVWVVPALMKKNRPGHELRVLGPPAQASGLVELIMTVTGTLGVRSQVVTKHVAPRWWTTVEIHGQRVRVKHGPHGAKPEHDDLVAASEATGLPLQALSHQAVAATTAKTDIPM